LETSEDTLDITGEVCPMTFVRTKLRLEQMSAGAVLRIRLRGAEPLANVPRALADHGHEILAQRALDGEAHELVVRKVARSGGR
jgi:TusA-related sulfurtransferase